MFTILVDWCMFDHYIHLLQCNFISIYSLFLTGIKQSNSTLSSFKFHKIMKNHKHITTETVQTTIHCTLDWTHVLKLHILYTLYPVVHHLEASSSTSGQTFLISNFSIREHWLAETRIWKR